MFKVLRFLDGQPGLAETLASHWAQALGARPSDPPVRVSVAAPLTEAGFPPPPFAAVDIQWFTDRGAALETDARLTAANPELRIGSSLLGGSSCSVVAEEVVMRGEDYIDLRWQTGGDRLKMMSFGKRNPRLTLEEFLERWRGQAGRLGGEAIPEQARGLAYIQNHPLLLEGHAWPFDAINEVYFDHLEHLRERQAYFAARQEAALRTEAESFMSPTETGSMFVREWPVSAEASARGA